MGKTFAFYGVGGMICRGAPCAGGGVVCPHTFKSGPAHVFVYVYTAKVQYSPWIKSALIA